MPIGRKQERSYGYVLTLRSKDKIMGANNNFVCQLPSAFAVTSENYLIKLINAHIPLPQYDTNTNATHLYRSAGVEVCVDFGAKTNSIDTNRGGLQSYGFTKMPSSVITSQSTALENDGDKPTHVVSKLLISFFIHSLLASNATIPFLITNTKASSTSSE